jgi:hypothetical protein
MSDETDENDMGDRVEFINSLIPKYVSQNAKTENKKLLQAYEKMVEYIINSMIFDIHDEADFNDLYNSVLAHLDSTAIVLHFRDQPEYEDHMEEIFKYSTGKLKADDLPSTIRVERPIKFSGKTKIVEIKNLTTGEIIYKHPSKK